MANECKESCKKLLKDSGNAEMHLLLLVMKQGS